MTSSELNSSALNLASTLAAQRAAASELADVLRRKQRILVEHRLSELLACAEREQALASQLALLETQRLEQAQALADSLAGPGGIAPQITLREMLDFLPDCGPAQLLREIADGLQGELDSLQALNADNCLLTQNLLDYTALVIRLLTQGTAKPAYSAHGRLREAPVGTGVTLVDNQI